MAHECNGPWATLMAPVRLPEFMQEHWNRAALYSSGNPARIGALSKVAQWRKSSWLRDMDAATHDRHGEQVQIRVGLDDALDRYSRGATICGDVSADPYVASLLDALRRDLGAPGQGFAKLYASPPQAGFAMHMDGDHVFVGRKRWWYSAAPALVSAMHPAQAGPDGTAIWAYPREGRALDDAGQPIAAPQREDLLTAVLSPGDWLYLPPGSWHTTEAERHSVAVSISPARVPTMRWVLEAVAASAQQRQSCRGDLVALGAKTEAGRVAAGVERDVQACVAELRAVLDDLDCRSVHRSWMAAVRGDDGGPREDGRPPTAGACEPPPAGVQRRPAVHHRAGAGRTRRCIVHPLGGRRVDPAV